jgi:hypothetical protein
VKPTVKMWEFYHIQTLTGLSTLSGKGLKL